MSDHRHTKPEPITRDRAVFIANLVRAGTPLEPATIEDLVNHALRSVTGDVEQLPAPAVFNGPDGSFPV